MRYDDDEDEQQEAGGQVTAAEWRELRVALAQRLRDLNQALAAAATDQERVLLQRQVSELKQQVQTLAVEETVAQFVEDSERYVLATNTIREELSRDPDAEVA